MDDANRINVVTRINMERIEIRQPINVSSAILAAVSNTHNISTRDAQRWVRTEIAKSVENEIMFADGIPHSNKEASKRFVISMLGMCGVAESEATSFFDTNFIYSPSTETPSSEIHFAQTVWEASEEMAGKILADLTNQDKVELMRLLNEIDTKE